MADSGGGRVRPPIGRRSVHTSRVATSPNRTTTSPTKNAGCRIRCCPASTASEKPDRTPSGNRSRARSSASSHISRRRAEPFTWYRNSSSSPTSRPRRAWIRIPMVLGSTARFHTAPATRPGSGNRPTKTPTTLSATPAASASGTAHSRVSGLYTLSMERISPARSRQSGASSGSSYSTSEEGMATTRAPRRRARLQKSMAAAVGAIVGSIPRRPRYRSRRISMETPATEETSRMTSYCCWSTSSSSRPVYGAQKTSVAYPTEMRRSGREASRILEPATDAPTRSVSWTRFSRACGRGRARSRNAHTYVNSVPMLSIAARTLGRQVASWCPASRRTSSSPPTTKIWAAPYTWAASASRQGPSISGSAAVTTAATRGAVAPLPSVGGSMDIEKGIV